MTLHRSNIVTALLAGAMALAAIAPIRNYDFFWHLAAGRWIVENRALPLTDPFAVASDRVPWINGEWLYEVAIYLLHGAAGLPALSIVRGLFAGLLFTTIYLVISRRSNPSDRPESDFRMTAMFLCTVAFAGASQTLDVRPASVAMAFLAASLFARTTLAHAALTIVWVNVHPSALIAPLIAALRTRRLIPALASGLSLLVNPFGWKAVAAPVELLLYVRSGAFVNMEWLPSPPATFPLLYVCVAVAALILGKDLAAAEERQARLERWSRILLTAFFAYLAIRHVRNQGLFYTAFPILIAPSIGAVRIHRGIVYAASAATIIIVAATTDHRLGVAPERFPLRATESLRLSGLAGNIYNPDQFGGLLIWTFYPERRALTDGRNELYKTFIPEYAEARLDGILWRALLEKYRIDLAVDEYSRPLEVVNAVTGERASQPASLVYWPRNQWALIAFDEAGMVFARRNAFPNEVLEAIEIRGIVPDAISPHRAP